MSHSIRLGMGAEYVRYTVRRVWERKKARIFWKFKHWDFKINVIFFSQKRLQCTAKIRPESPEFLIIFPSCRF